MPLLGQIPLDPPMRDFADHGRPVVASLPDAPSARAFEEIVDRMLELYPPKPKARKRKNLPLVTGPQPNGRTVGHAHQH